MIAGQESVGDADEVVVVRLQRESDKIRNVHRPGYRMNTTSDRLQCRIPRLVKRGEPVRGNRD
ncbi:hypothetical protein ACVWYH_005655 [Bradyrhizobium sp. GM24.11]